ncbi:LysR family transcriptional regulator [Streptomyces xinghaiensis]|uniref:LysR family transcriptional regulator n=1 Tax=Streptomyces xinghaiensis TaxID=1038928 RepID=UPI0002E647CB|nr:LysR family transcriptional regulator [Streptomyces xinghaiensis]MZE81035.1 LysR family transcriptional regulator [Streptomyces sp. SID5475]
MDVPQLDAFITVVEAGSFTRAAARLGLSQPTVTTRIKSLEVTLGTTLVDRLPSGVRPTPAGTDLLPYAREIVRLTGHARQAVGSGGQPHGRLDIGAVESLASYRLPPLVEYLFWRYPKLQVSIHTAASGTSVADVRDGRLDCAFIIDTRHEREGLRSAVLCPEPLVLVGGPSHLLVDRTEITDADLRTASLTRADNNAEYHTRYEQAIGLHRAAERPRIFELGSVDAVKRSVHLGLGMALLPLVTVRRELEERQLFRIGWTVPFEAYSQIVWRAGHTCNTGVDALVDSAVRVVKEQHETEPADGVLH